MPKSHRDYKFGTIQERLEHCCALFEVDPPEIEYEDDEVLLTDPLIAWVKENGINMDWLFVGSPDGLLRVGARANKDEARIVESLRKLEPEVQNGMLALLKAVVQHNLPVEESLQVFDQVVKEWRMSHATETA